MSDPQSLLGQTISHYRIVEKLGGGGMNARRREISLCAGRPLSDRVGIFDRRSEAVRKSRPAPLEMTGGGGPFRGRAARTRAQALERFRREARAASALNHPNIRTIHEIGEENGRAFITASKQRRASLDFRSMLVGLESGCRGRKKRHAGARPPAKGTRAKPACAALAIWLGRLCSGALGEAGHGFGFGIEDVEDRQQFRDLQDFLEFRAEMAEAERSTLRLHAVMRGDERAQAGAVNECNVVHVQDNLLLSSGDQAFYFFA